MSVLLKVKTLQEEKRVLEEKLEGCRHTNQEERDKAAIIASEKRARGQVRGRREEPRPGCWADASCVSSGRGVAEET